MHALESNLVGVICTLYRIHSDETVYPAFCIRVPPRFLLQNNGVFQLVTTKNRNSEISRL